MRNSRKLVRSVSCSAGCVGAAILLMAANASAQESAANPTLGEVVVTAQKRTENLINVPLSITAVDGNQLERRQAVNFQDYLGLVPGLQLTQETPGQGRLVMRGINTQGVASTVAVYVDETPFGSSSGLVNGAALAGDFDTFDMQRLEVLRGPQGTLYGASSMGGVLKFATNAPRTDKFDAKLRAGAETTEHGEMSYVGEGMVNIPVSESFALRGVGYYRQQGGYIDSIGTPAAGVGPSDVQDDINTSDSYGGRVSALLKPSDKFSLQLTAIMQDLRTDAQNNVESDPNSYDALYNNLTQSQFVPEFTNVDYRVYNATIDWDVGFATLTSATSYNELDQPYRRDFTTLFSPLLAGLIGPNNFMQEQTTKYDKFTQELRLASPSNARLEWLVGAYYTSEKGDIIQHLEAVIPGTLDPIQGLPILGDLSLHSEYEEIAGFASATIHFGDRFDLTAGGRYSSNDQSAKQDAIGFFVDPSLQPVSYPNATSSEDVFTYSLAPKLKFGDNASLYARVASGFRPGGPNVLAPGVPAGVPPTYDSDSLVSYEVGYKVESASHVFSLDIAAFHIDWKDIQVLGNVNNINVNLNGGKATSDGAEFTATARVGEGLSLSLNGAYTDAKLEDDTPPEVGGLKGDALPYTPEWSLGLNADYDWSIGATTTAYVGGALRYLSDQTAAYDLGYRTVNGKQREIPSYEVLDLQAGLDFGQFSIELYGKNLTDSEGKTAVGSLGTVPNGALPTAVIRPRTIGISFGVNF